MKSKTKFVCSECGFEAAKWLGKCSSCGAWNSFTEEMLPQKAVSGSARAAMDLAGVGSGSINRYSENYSAPVPLKDVAPTGNTRINTGIEEFNRVLGGGLVTGSLVLIGGDPGIGKSTLLLQICDTLAKSGKVLYVSGEESAHQLKIRGERLGIKSADVYISSKVDIDEIIADTIALEPKILIVDSIQTVFNTALTSSPGSVSQVREVTMSLMRLAKSKDVTIFIVGHVTKDGSIAGPRVLEHMVDSVLYFEGERHLSYRILRAVKNRFGSTNEIGVFEMQAEGLVEVANPSEAMLSGRGEEEHSGSAVVCVMEGSRPILVEVQALVSQSGFGMPRRNSTGIDQNRSAMLMAVLEKKLKFNLANQDGYINIAGGIKVNEPACDLGVCVAVASSFKNFIIPNSFLFVGEVGLTGEVRGVSNIERRIAEAKKMGFSTCVVPFAHKKQLKDIKGIEILGVKNIYNALDLF